MEISPDEKYICLETYRKNGSGIRTPVWFVIHENLVWVVTREKTGKVKRIQNNSKVKIAVSNFSGKPKGSWQSGIAKFSQDIQSEKIISLRDKKYGFISKLIRPFTARKGGFVVFSINLEV